MNVPRVLLGSLGLLSLLGPSIFGQAVPTWRLEPAYTLGTAASNIEFSYIHDMVADPDGRIWILDRADPFLRSFSTAGTQLTATGRLGDGPGELRQPTLLAQTADGVWIYDARQSRVTIVPRDGGPARTQNPRIRLPPEWSGGRPIAPTPDGEIVAYAIGTSGGVGGGGFKLALVAQPPGDATARVLQIMDQRNASMRLDRTTVNGQRSGGSARQPFSNDPLWSVANDGARYVVANRDPAPTLGAGTFTVTLAETTGRVVFNREYRYRPRRLNDATVAEAVQRIQTPPGLPPGLKRETDPSEIQEKLYRPQFIPPLDEVLLAGDGRIWIRRSRLASDTEVLYLIMSDAGDLLGEVSLPPSARVLDAHGDRVWVSDYSPKDEPVVTMFRIRR